MAQHRPLLCRSGVQRLGRASDVHWIAGMGVGKVQHDRPTAADAPARVPGHDPAGHSPIRSGWLLLEKTAPLPWWPGPGPQATLAHLASLERAERDGLLRRPKGHRRGLRAALD